MPQRLMNKLIKEFKIIRLPKDQVVAKSGSEEIDTFYLILRGEITYYKIPRSSDNQDGKEVKNYFQGDQFGGGSQSEEYIQYAQTKSKSVLLSLTKPLYDEMLQDYHESLLQDKMNFISSVSLFSQISQKRLKNKLYIFKENSFPSNSDIYKEGQPISFIYIIISGTVEISQVIQLDQCKKNIRVSLSLCIPGIIFGETEYIEKLSSRRQKATCKGEVKVFKLQISDLISLLDMSHQVDRLAYEHRSKNQFWKQRIQKIAPQQIKIQSDHNIIKPEVDIIYENYAKKVNWKKTYNNYQPAHKMIWKKNQPNEEQEEAKLDKMKEIEALFQSELKKNFQNNHIMKRFLIETKKKNIKIKALEGLDLSKYINLKVEREDRVEHLLKRYSSLQQMQQMEKKKEKENETHQKTELSNKEYVKIGSRLYSAVSTQHYTVLASPSQKRPTTPSLCKKPESVKNSRPQSVFQTRKQTGYKHSKSFFNDLFDK